MGTRVNLALIALLAPATTPAQEWPISRDPIPKTILEKLAKANRLYREGRVLERSEKLNPALSNYEEGWKLEVETMGQAGACGHRYALIQSGRGNNKEALIALKSAFRYDDGPRKGLLAAGGAWANDKRTIELRVNGPMEPHIFLDYMVELAKTGRIEDAKLVYYSLLRQLPSADTGFDPVPFLVVFDLDPNGEYLEPTLENFELVALLLKYGTFVEDIGARISKAKPDWYLPYLFSATYTSGPQVLKLIRKARSLATTERQRHAIDQYELRWRKQPAEPYDPFAERQKISILKDWHEKLKKDHARVAIN